MSDLAADRGAAALSLEQVAAGVDVAARPAGDGTPGQASRSGVALPAIGALIATLALAGWIADLAALRRFGTDLPDLRLSTAVCLLLLAFAGVALALGRGGRLAPSAAAGTAGVLAALALTEWLVDHPLGVDHLWLPGHVPAAGGRMSPQTAVTVLILALAMVFALWRGAAGLVAQTAAVAVLFSSVTGLVGVGFGVSPQWRLSSVIGMTVPGALALLMLASGVLAAAPAGEGVLGLVTGRGPGGRLLRILLPVALLSPLTAGFGLAALRDLGMLDEASAWSLFVVAGMVLPATVTVVTAVALERTAELRAAAVEAVRSSAAQLARQRSTLLRVTEDLGRATEAAHVADAAVSTVAEALGARTASLLRFDPPDRCTVLASTARAGTVERRPGRSEAFRLADDALAADVIGTRRAVLLGSPAERDSRYPALAGRPEPHQASASLPLLVDGRPIGVIAFGWPAPRHFDSNDAALLNAVASLCATALDRARLFDAERAARAATERAQRRLALLAEVGAVLADANETDLVDRLAHLLAQEMSAWCEVLQPDEDGQLRRSAIAVAEADLRSLAAAFRRAPVSGIARDDPRMVAWRTGRPVRLNRGRPAGRTDWGDTDADHDLTPSPAGPLGPILAVPLVARGECNGVLNLMRRRGGCPFTADDERLLLDVGYRAGAALDNLRLLAARTRVAARLQESLLPQRLPTIPRAELAVRYVTREDTAEVGGDFYDAFQIADGEYALIIGDVAGRGVDAAGLTGLARTTLRALGADVSPAAALGRLNDLMLSRSDGERFLTAAYLRLRLDPGGVRPQAQPAAGEHGVDSSGGTEPAAGSSGGEPTGGEPTGGAGGGASGRGVFGGGGELTACVAGHPLPLLARPGADPEPIGASNPVLGVLPGLALTEQTHRLYPGDVVLLFTDGVTEARGAEGLFGEARLKAALRGASQLAAEAVVSHLEHVLRTYRTSAGDDTALMALRLVPPTEPSQHQLLELHLPADTVAVRAARRATAGATANLLPRGAVPDVLLAVSELVTNAVRQLQRQPTRTLRPDPIALRVLYRADVLRVEVHNPGPAFELPAQSPAPDPYAEHGRGLAVVQALASRVGVDHTGDTMCVWFELALDDCAAIDGD